MATNYNHIAYSKSADGKEGFTRLYPNLNLITGLNREPTSATIPINGYYSTVKIFTPNDLETIRGKNVTASIYIDATQSTSDLMINLHASPGGALRGSIVKAGTKGWSIITREYPVDATSGNIAIVTPSAVKTPTPLIYSEAKIEASEIRTPWMPHESEVTSQDYPTYIGTYTDENENSSTNPADYTWEMMNYRIYLDGIAVAGSKLLSAKVENLKPDTSYIIQVKQVSGEEESDFSDSVTFKTNVQK